MLRNNSKQFGESMWWILKKKKEGLRWEEFAEKPGMKKWVGDGIPSNSKYDSTYVRLWIVRIVIVSNL